MLQCGQQPHSPQQIICMHSRTKQPSKTKRMPHITHQFVGGSADLIQNPHLKQKQVVEHYAGMGLPSHFAQADFAHAKVALHPILQQHCL